MRIPLPKESVATTDIAFTNHILVDSNYHEQRIPICTEPRFTFDLEGIHLRKPDVLVLLEFITEEAKGKLNTFRYRHPYFHSCKAYRVYQDPNNFTYQRGVLVPIKASSTQYQCAIEFGLLGNSNPIPSHTPFQDPSLPTTVSYKTITKLGTSFKVYTPEGVLVANTDYQVDQETGVVTFAQNRENIFYWEADFDLEVRFDSDDVFVELVVQNVPTSYNPITCDDLYKLSNLKLIEISSQKITPPTIANLNLFLPQSEAILDLGIQPIISTASLFQTKIESFERGYETRDSRSLGNRYTSAYTACKLQGWQAYYLFTFFVAVKGNLLKFKLKDPLTTFKEVRFKEESLRLTLIKRRPERNLFDLESVSFQSTIFG